jgi:hypothetical protein
MNRYAEEALLHAHRTNTLMAILLCLIALTGPHWAWAEEVTQGDTRMGEFPICSDLGNAMKMATILADEGEEKAGEFQQDPATPCGSTVLGTYWIVGEVRYVLQGKDGQWVRVVELHAPPQFGITRYWVTRVDVLKPKPAPKNMRSI